MVFNVKNYETGDEEAQASVYNEVIKEFDSNAQEVQIEQIKERYKQENWNSNQVTYLVDENNNIIGYAGFAFNNGTVALGYPYIIKKHRNIESLNKLFDAQLAEIEKISDKNLILANYQSNLRPIHEFFEKRGYNNKQEAIQMRVDVEKLNQPIKGFASAEFKEEDIPKVVKFLNANRRPQQQEFTEEGIKQLFINETLNGKNAFIIEKEGEIYGISGVGVQRDSDPKTGFLNFFGVNLNKDSIELRKALAVSIYPYLHAEEIKVYQSLVASESLSRKVFEDLGFETDENGGNITYFF